eukprot:COSAG02_NODE_1747_length_11077_cov_31.871470_6_plen_172_part_00
MASMSSHSAPSTCFSIHSDARSCASITPSRTPHSSAARFGAPRLSIWTIYLTEISQRALSCGWSLRARGLLLHRARHRSSGDEARDVGGVKGHRSCAPPSFNSRGLTQLHMGAWREWLLPALAPDHHPHAAVIGTWALPSPPSRRCVAGHRRLERHDRKFLSDSNHGTATD